MAVVLDAVDKLTLAQDEKLSIIDLCSGFGFLAMFLSELLPPEKVPPSATPCAARLGVSQCKRRVLLRVAKYASTKPVPF
jgi:hypothetical protein